MTRTLAYLLPVAVLALVRFTMPANICDDAYITLKVALNTAAGDWFEFNPGERIFVTTSPLWTMAIAALSMLTRDVVVAVQLLGVVCEAALLVSIVHLSERLSLGNFVGSIAAVLLVTNPVFILTSLSGMELPLYLLAIVVAADLVVRRHHLWALVVAATALWIRFDGLFLYASTLAFVLWQSFGSWENLRSAELRRSTARALIPSLVILAAYPLFGQLVFDSPIPTSVLRKAGTSAAIFSVDWFQGVELLTTELLKATLGKSTYWYTADSPFFWMTLPFGIGLFLMFRHRELEARVLLVFGLVYGAALVSSGSVFARNFPWYFVPVLPAFYFVAAGGIVWLIDSLIGLGGARSSALRLRTVAVVGFAILWTFVLWRGAISESAEKLTGSELVGRSERESVYAAAAVFAGTHLPQGSAVAANEIGALGFFLPRSVSIVEMAGLLDPVSSNRDGYVDKIEDRRPELVFARSFYEMSKTIDEALPNMYSWYRFKSLNVGVRTDLVGLISPKLKELPAIRDSIDLNHEPAWPFAAP